MKLFRHIVTVVCIEASFIATAGEQLTAQAKCAVNQSTNAELKLLQGKWEGVDAGNKSGAKITITITGNSLHFYRDKDFWFENTITLPAGTNPQQLHATIKGNAPSGGSSSIGKVVVAIFKIEDGTLTLAPTGDDSDEKPLTFEAVEANGGTIYKLQKVQPQKKDTGLPKSEK